MAKKITYLDTYCEGGYSYEDYKEWCEECEVGVGEEGGEDYWNWIYENHANDVEDFFENLKYSKEPGVNHPVVVTGTLGLWWGRPEISPTRFDCLFDAVRQCMDGADSIQVELEDGVVEVRTMHHDGTNVFEIRPVDGTFGEYLY